MSSLVNPEIKKKLIEEAMKVREKSYSPYSNYKVGAAVLTKSGKIYTGTNIENASYTLTVHAEQAAIVSALLGEKLKDRKFIQLVAIVHDNNTAPCGICRQFIKEFCDDCIIINALPDGEFEEYKLSEILPRSFSPTNLDKS